MLEGETCIGACVGKHLIGATMARVERQICPPDVPPNIHTSSIIGGNVGPVREELLAGLPVARG